MKAIFVAALLVASALAQVKKLIATTTFIDTIVNTNMNLIRIYGARTVGVDPTTLWLTDHQVFQNFSPGILGQSSELL